MEQLPICKRYWTLLTKEKLSGVILYSDVWIAKIQHLLKSKREVLLYRLFKVVKCQELAIINLTTFAIILVLKGKYVSFLSISI